MGLDDSGFTAPRAADYLALGIAEFKALTGVDLSARPNNVLYIMLYIASVFLDGLGQAAQAVYDARSVNNATGVQLDNLGQIKGVARKPATFSTVTVLLTTSIPVPSGNQIAASPTGERWALADDANLITGTVTSRVLSTITTDYTADYDFTGYNLVLTGGTGASPTAVPITAATTGAAAQFTVASWPAADPDATTTWAIEAAIVVAEPVDTGPIEAVAESLTTIVTPQPGWTAVTNPADAVAGTDIETDTAYRVRIQLEQPNNGARSPAGLLSSLLAIPGVDAALVLSNPTDTNATVQGVAMTPKSGAVVIWPDPIDDTTKKTVNAAIYNQISFGIGTIGAETGTVYDATGTPQTIHWGYASEVDVDVVTTVVLADGYALADVTTLITDAVAAFFAALSIGNDVYVARVEQAVLDALPTQITGISLTLNGGGSVTIAGDEIAILGTNTATT